MMAFRIAWFKIYYPLAFYAASFTVRTDDFDADVIAKGLPEIEKQMQNIKAMGNEATDKDKKFQIILELALELYQRGYSCERVNLLESDAENFRVVDGRLIPPFMALQGLGQSVALSLIHIFPVIADIHFNHRLALLAMDNGIAALRINPGNIGSKQKVQEVVSKAKELDVPIRIGVNAGSLEKDLLEQYGHPTAEALVESAMRHVRILEELNFENIKISLKASDVPLMIAAYRLIAQQVPYPLHLGVTEAGNAKYGTVKSAVGIGTLLAEGIGDTIRVCLLYTSV